MTRINLLRSPLGFHHHLSRLGLGLRLCLISHPIHSLQPDLAAPLPLLALPIRRFSTSTSPSNLSHHSGMEAKAQIPIFRTVASYREWRQQARDEGKSVGFVPTMGALHEGHLSLGPSVFTSHPKTHTDQGTVRESLKDNDLTVVSIFVNPAQFAPGEDLHKYPATFESDMAALSNLSLTVPSSSSHPSPHSSSSSSSSIARTPSAIFAPTTSEMYPSGISLDRSLQRGTFIEVLGYSHHLEGRTRPHFFRGVCSVVIKLFNAVEPTNAYFGQKDIQQALILRRLVTDLLLSHPFPSGVHVIPTTRESDGLALSSRNVYLGEVERKWAVCLWKALERGRSVWEEWIGGRSSGGGDGVTVGEGSERVWEIWPEVERVAQNEIANAKEEAAEEGVEIELDYISFVDADTFENPLPPPPPSSSPSIPTSTSTSNSTSTSEPSHRVTSHSSTQIQTGGKAYLLCGAMKVGSTRLIDNIILGNVKSIIH